jgi:hypothetical protein
MGTATTEVKSRDRMLSRRMIDRSIAVWLRATRTGPAIPQPNKTITIPRMPIDWPVAKLPHPSGPTTRVITGSMMKGASAERIGAPVKPANLNMSDRIGLSLRVVAEDLRTRRGVIYIAQ